MQTEVEKLRHQFSEWEMKFVTVDTIMDDRDIEVRRSVVTG